MCDLRLRLAAFAVLCLFAAVPQGPALAMTAQPLAAQSRALSQVTPPVVLRAAQEAPRFHGKRAQSVYCLRRNHWWFYRPYTTAQEDFPRCEPYFHYLEPANGRRGARADPYFK